MKFKVISTNGKWYIYFKGAYQDFELVKDNNDSIMEFETEQQAHRMLAKLNSLYSQKVR